jgi:hypothetical protein
MNTINSDIDKAVEAFVELYKTTPNTVLLGSNQAILMRRFNAVFTHNPEATKRPSNYYNDLQIVYVEAIDCLKVGLIGE